MMDEELSDIFVSKLIEKLAELSKENDELKKENQILVEALRDLQWKLDGLNK